jgi:hypothetical protein
LAPPADEVEVQVAFLAFPAHDHQASAAAIAPERAFEVVVMDAGACSAAALTIE